MRGSSAFARAARGRGPRGRRAAVARSLASPPHPPAWVHAWLGGATPQPSATQDCVRVEVLDAVESAFARIVVEGARALAAEALQRGVERAYGALERAVSERGLAPLRIWNYVPGIRAPAAGGLSRYEVFNLGRHRSVAAWPALPAASAIDHHGPDLELHVLAGRAPGEAIENPRQVPAYRYSERYGPRPPCFVRARRVAAPRGAGPVGLVSGTASIVGEDSRHAADLDAQLDETCANLDALAQAARFTGYRALRAYVVREADAGRVARRLRCAYPGVEELELFRADLCRPELLVEIEALADARP